MTADERLTEVFDRGLRDGVDTLSPVDRELFLIQDFIIELEMGGLSGYFYNRLPALDQVTATVGAMSRHGLSELAALLGEASGLFQAYEEPNPPETWDETLQRYDPMGRLEVLASRIRALDGYGLGKSSIADTAPSTHF
jgi:hypothetical protein